MTSNSETAAKGPPAKAAPRRLGKYEIQRQLGAGGMGAVYLAKDVDLKRLVALKVLPRERASNPTLVKRFKAEAQAAAQLRHENIVAIYDSGEVDGQLYIAMEYVDGTDLHETIRKRGKVPVKRALEIVKQTAAALQHAHELNIVHRDIKPSNLLIRSDGAVKLTDLGLARSVDDTLETDITRAGTTVGTVDYMSPEQGRNSKAADTRSDIYSLGCTWYHMLTGKPPFPEGSMTNKLQAHAVKPPPDPRDDNEAVTEATVAVLHRMMAKKPEDRYQTPEELLKDLSRPALTRGGVQDEVYSAISESEDFEQPARPARRSLPPGKLPPKKKPAAKEEEDKDTFWNWETLQPLVWGGLMLIAIIGVGLIVAKLSGNLDFGGGVAKQETKPTSGDPAQIVGQSGTGGAVAQAGAGNVVGPDGTLVASADAGPAAVTGETPTNGAVVASPSTVSGDATGDGAPDGGTSVAGESSVPRTFDAENIPEWSQAGSSSATGNGGGNDADSGTGPSTTRPSTNRAPNPKATGPTPRATQPNPTQVAGRDLGGPSGQTSIGGAESLHGLKTVHVGGKTRAGNHYPALSEALRALPPEGGVVRFASAGPFLLPRVDFPSARRLVLMAEPGQAPIVLLKPAPGELTAGLHLGGGLVEADGIHFVADRSVMGTSDPVAVITVTDGQLAVRRCTFTAWGDGPAPVAAMRIGSKLEPDGKFPPLEPRVLIEQVFTRGDLLSALVVDRPCADVVVRESLLASGSAAVVRVSGSLPEALAAKPSSRPRRAIRFLQSTLFGKGTIFELTAPAAGPPPSTAVLLQDTICATTADATLIDAAHWPLAETAVESGSRLVNLGWRMKDSAAVGFPRLAVLGSSTIAGSDLDAWQTLWNGNFSAAEFPTKSWPDAELSDLASITPADFPRDTLAALEIARLSNSPPGCDGSLLPNPTAVSQRRLTALALKPVFPPVPAEGNPPMTVQIDATKQDLGRELQNGAWPAGTVIEVTGSGVRQMTPVSLTDKSWKIVGKPQEGATLAFTPKPVATGATALVEAIRGSLELVNLRFQVPATTKSSLQCLVGGHGSRLTLVNVNLQGVLTNAEALESLLYWSGESGGQGGLVCRDSMFVGSGRALKLRLGSGPIQLRNCLIVSRGDGLDIDVPALDPGAAAGAVSVDHVTFSTTLGALHLRADSLPPGGAPHRFYFDECVFAPSLAARSNEPYGPTVFRLSQPQHDLKSIEWWGSSNGLSTEITTLIRGEKDQGATDQKTELARWRNLWGDEQDTRFLTGPGGVVLNEPNAKATIVKPEQFALHPSAKATTWGNDETAIGVDLRRLDGPVAPAPKKANGKEPAKKTQSQPDF